MYLRKARAGSGAGYTWNRDQAVVDVPDHLAHELLCIPDGGFTEVRPGQLDDPAPGTPADLALAADGLRTELFDRLVAGLAALREELLTAVALAAGDLRTELLTVVGAGGTKTLTAEGPAAPAAVSMPGASADGGGASANAGADAPGSPKPASSTSRPAGGGNARR